MLTTYHNRKEKVSVIVIIPFSSIDIVSSLVSVIMPPLNSIVLTPCDELTVSPSPPPIPSQECQAGGGGGGGGGLKRSKKFDVSMKLVIS